MARFLSALVVSLLLVGTLIATWMVFAPRPEPANPALATPAMASLNERLARQIKLDISAQSAKAALEALAREHGLSLSIDASSDGPFPGASDRVVTHHVPQLALGDALRFLAFEMHPDAVLVVQDDGLHIMAEEEAEKLLVTRFYTTGALLARLGASDEELASAILQNRFFPSWDTSYGKGHVESRPGGIAVVNHPQAIAEVEALLACLEKFASAENPQPLWIGDAVQLDETLVDPRLKARLAAGPEFEPLQPLARVAELFEQQTGIPFVLDKYSIEAVGASPDTPISSVEANIPIQDSLRLLLSPCDLTYCVKNGAVYISSPEEIYNELRSRAYPVGDLLRAAPGKDMDDLIDIVSSTIQPESWDSVGGKGSIMPVGSVLVITQVTQVHSELEALLEKLRRVLLHGDPGPYSLSPWLNSTPEQEAILVALDRNVSIDVTEARLQDVCESMAHATKLNIVLDRKAIEAVGASADTPVTFKRLHWPLRNCLRSMLRPMDLTYVVRDGVLYITTPEEAGAKLVTQIYGIGHLIDPLHGVFEVGSADEVEQVVRKTLAPETWDFVGGKGAITMFGEALIVSQTQEVLRQMASLLAGLERFQAEPPSLVPLDFQIPRPYPPPPPHIQAKLAEKVNWSFREVTFANLDKECRKSFGMSFDPRFLEYFQSNKPFRCRFENVPLRDALDVIIGHEGLAYEIDYDRILPSESGPYYVRLYPTPGFADSLPGAAKAKQLSTPRFTSFLDLMQEMVAPETWDVVGGRGDAVRLRGAYLITQRSLEHKQLEQFFAAVIAARKLGAQRESPLFTELPPSDALLARRVTLDIEATSLADFAAQLSDQLHVSVYVGNVTNNRPVLSCHARDLPLIDVLARALKDSNIRFMVEQGVLIFEERAVPFGQTRVYNVASLLPDTAATLHVDDSPLSPAENFERAVRKVGRAEDWDENGGIADVALWGNLLVVRHSATGQYEVRQFLETLRTHPQGREAATTTPTANDVIALIERRLATTNAAERGYCDFLLRVYTQIPARAWLRLRAALAQSTPAQGLEWFTSLWAALETTGSIVDADREVALKLTERFLNGRERHAAIEHLGKLGPAAVPRLRALLAERNAYDLASISAACYKLGPEGDALLPDVLMLIYQPTTDFQLIQAANSLDPTYTRREVVLKKWDESGDQVLVERARTLRPLLKQNPIPNPGGFF